MTRDEALAALDAGRVVAVPTDTVYGLAARIDRPQALGAIFSAKGRPPDVALPVLIGRWRQVRLVASEWPRTAAAVAARYWPGPLTVVVPARPDLGPLLGGDGHTAGLRQPRHREVQWLCREAGPLAVTSANRHGEPPATTAEEVRAAFGGGEVSVVMDGGRCDGVPSTVVDCTVTPPVCLREGGVPWPWVEAALR
ncbi:MAG TPA: L-threonylcarbamoyladenylate synthase [Acidimicrobiales bacterium]|nr:L-threonylcarbamoyladenylate synthase [Acidimicrobiales bacterium]